MNDPIRQLLTALENTQWMPADLFGQYQDRLLVRMLEHAFRHTDYYASALAPFFRDERIRLEDWKLVPFLTRGKATENTEALIARQVPPESGGSSSAATSGSTARAFHHMRSDLVLWLNSAMTERGYKWFGVDFAGTLASIRDYDDSRANSPDGDVRPGAWAAGGGGGTYAMMNIATGTRIQHAWLERVKPDYLSTYPSVAVALADTAGGNEWPRTLRTVFVVGETLSDEQRQKIRNGLGARVVNTYGASETGLLAFECPVSGLMHLMAESAKIEIVLPDGTSAKDGDAGEIAVTSLVNFAMPLIRYKTGDHAEFSAAPCPCGRTLPTVRRILGRTRNMFRRPDGSYVWPNVLSRVFGKYVPHRQFRFIQRSLTGIELIYVPVAGDQKEDRAAMLAYVRERLFPEVNLTFTRAGHIPSGSGGKYEDYIREIE